MRIRGTMLEIMPVEVIGDKVYLRKGIVRIEEEGDEIGGGFVGWEYDEDIVLLSEYMAYMELLGQQNTDLELMVIEQGQYVTDLDLRLFELEVK